MPAFSYTAITTTGEDVVGVIEADSQSKAVEALKAQMLMPTSLKRTDASAPMSKCNFCGHRNPDQAGTCEECGATILDRDRKPTVDLGDDLPKRMLDFVTDAFRHQHGIDLRADETVLPRLQGACEKAAEELQSVESTEINLPFITADASGPKHLNMSVTRSQFQYARSESDEILDLLRSRQKIAAIKLYREQYGVGLADAKNAVEDLARQHNIVSGGGGCASVLFLLLICSGTVSLCFL